MKRIHANNLATTRDFILNEVKDEQFDLRQYMEKMNGVRFG